MRPSPTQQGERSAMPFDWMRIRGGKQRSEASVARQLLHKVFKGIQCNKKMVTHTRAPLLLHHGVRAALSQCHACIF